jgi:hypothetical protein
MTDFEVKMCAEWAAEQIMSERHNLRGFWSGFAAGAFGVMLALGITWMIYS